MSAGNLGQLLVSADSHVIEPIKVWDGLVSEEYWGDAPSTFSQRPGGFDAAARIDEMAADAVSAEVLYPSLAMKLFSLEDAELQRACFHRYNEWLAEYCSVAPERLIGTGLLSCYDAERAVEEAHWCRSHGLRGVQVWQTPPSHLPFESNHYEIVWAACAELRLPVSLHILTGFDYSREVYQRGGSLPEEGLLMYELSINDKLHAAMSSLLTLILGGALDRHPDLRFIIVENEIGWIPFFLDQLDYYYERFQGRSPIQLTRPPSQVFREQIGATFFRDANAAAVAERLRGDSVMWSSDYPHGNSTWPHSQEVVVDRLNGLSDELVDRLSWKNVTEVFSIDLRAEDHV